MRYLPIEDITEEMTLARPIFGGDGRVLLTNGVKLTSTFLKKLKEMEYTHLYVYEPEDQTMITFTPPISDSTNSEALQGVRDSFIQATKRQNMNLKYVYKAVDYIIDEILENPLVLHNVIDIYNHSTYIYLHSVNVCVISTIIGKRLELARDKVKELAIGALLHDLGMVCIEPLIIETSSCLTKKEFEQIREHSKFGYDLLRTVPNLSILTAHVAYQHHEREDGSGYPRRLTGKDIHIYAKIVAVADSYDAMTSSRIYKKALWSHEAIAELKNQTPTKYDPEVVEALIRSVALYPVGSVVLLSTNEEAVVVNVSTKSIIVQICGGERKNALMELQTDSEIRIECRLS